MALPLIAEDLVTSSFLGPYLPPANARDRGDDPRPAARRRQEVYLTLGHWYHAAKFMPHAPHHRDAVLISPTIKEAVKLSKKLQKEWRSDWPMRRHNILVCGMGLMALQRPDLGLREASLAEIARGLQPLGLPASFVRDCLELFDAWRTSPQIAVFGADSAPEQLVGQRMAKLASGHAAWSLLLQPGKRAPWRLHDWALYHFVPVRYFERWSARRARDVDDALVEAADQVVVFEARGSARHDRVIAAVKRSKKKLVLELYDAAPAVGAQQLAL